MTQILLTKLNKALLYKFLFYKHFYKYIFLHKPLCEKYKDNTLKIFGLYVCRSCLLLYTGFLISIILCITSIKSIHFDKYFYLGLAGLILTFIVSYPTIYSKFRRLTKDFIRFYDGIFLAAFFVVSFKFNLYAGFGSILVFILLRTIYNKKRSGDRICKGCEKLVVGKTCEGYIQQKQALLDLEEEYSNIIMRQMNKERMEL